MELEFEWMLEIALVLGAAKGLEALFVRVGLARVLAYITVGLIVAISKPFLGYEVSHILKAFAYLGIISLLFHAGLESSLRMFMRGLKKAGIVAVGGVLGALICGFIAAPFLGLNPVSAFALGTILSATSVSITVKTFEELGCLSSIEAQTIIGAAVVDDVLGLLLLGMLYSVSTGETNIFRLIEVTAIAFGLWIGVALSFEKFSRKLYRAVSRMRVEAGFEAVTLILLLFLAYLASKVGLSVILLAYAMGLGLASLKRIAHRIASKLEVFSMLFSPLFFVYSASMLDIYRLVELEIGVLVTTLVLMAILGIASKVIGCGVAALITGFEKKQALVVGFGMVPRAEVMLIAATAALELELIDHRLFASILTLIPLTLYTTPLILRKLYRGGRYTVK